MTYEAFTFEVADGIGHITLDQPDRGNPFDGPFCAELSLIAAECDENPEVRAVLIDAAGKYFSVGADLRVLGRDRADLPRFTKSATTGLHSAISRFSRMDAPVVAAVHGLAVGGGVSLAAAADFCLAGGSARFYAAYAGIGLSPDGGGTHALTRLVGPRRATEFYLRNQTWTADEAAARGLVSEVVDDAELGKRARELALELAGGPTRAFGEMKNLLLAAVDQPLEALLEAEARAMGRVTRTEDSWNAITAVSAKQRPTFEGH
ncbi:enoyl-CoA hydratase/isomerase family protein [Actinomycetospora sp.]|jgi:2-(1,2-epoxy-1,2-dihydrophenyl)acetyl-CoA isomerase|uniref:enoyl-CoA hydratase/isomerase family protein n=1 Tax=Actinomycetospora sp. TaxID=1872135 RepID=UPI002F405E3C